MRDSCNPCHLPMRSTIVVKPSSGGNLIHIPNFYRRNRRAGAAGFGPHDKMPRSSGLLKWHLETLLRTIWRPGCRGCRSEENTSELQSLMRNTYAVFGLKKKKINDNIRQENN